MRGISSLIFPWAQLTYDITKLKLLGSRSNIVCNAGMEGAWVLVSCFLHVSLEIGVLFFLG